MNLAINADYPLRVPRSAGSANALRPRRSCPWPPRSFRRPAGHGLWTLRAWVVPLATAYALYVPLNSVLFWYWQNATPHSSLASIIVSSVLGLGGAIGTALYVAFHRERFH